MRAWAPASSAGATLPTATKSSIINSTIADNTTKEESGGRARGPGAGLLISEGTANVAGSILAFNDEINASGNFTKTNCSTSGEGTIISLGYNIESERRLWLQIDRRPAEPALEFEFTSSEPQNNGGNTDTLSPRTHQRGRSTRSPPASRSAQAPTSAASPARRAPAATSGAVEMVPLTIRATEGSKFSGAGRDKAALRRRNPDHAHDRMGGRADIGRDRDRNRHQRQPHLRRGGDLQRLGQLRQRLRHAQSRLPGEGRRCSVEAGPGWR